MYIVGVVAESRNITQSIARRMEKYRQEQNVFEALRNHLAHLTENIEEVNPLAVKCRSALPEYVCRMLNGALECVRSSLFHFNETVKNDFRKHLQKKVAIEIKRISDFPSQFIEL